MYPSRPLHRRGHVPVEDPATGVDISIYLPFEAPALKIPIEDLPLAAKSLRQGRPARACIGPCALAMLYRRGEGHVCGEAVDLRARFWLYFARVLVEIVYWGSQTVYGAARPCMGAARPCIGAARSHDHWYED